MSETSRRKFLAAAGAGAAAAGTVAVTAGTAQARETIRRPDGAREAVVAYVKNHRSDELRLMVGEREVVVHNRDLVTRILNAAGGE